MALIDWPNYVVLCHMDMAFRWARRVSTHTSYRLPVVFVRLWRVSAPSIRCMICENVSLTNERTYVFAPAHARTHAHSVRLLMRIHRFDMASKKYWNIRKSDRFAFFIWAKFKRRLFQTNQMVHFAANPFETILANQCAAHHPPHTHIRFRCPQKANAKTAEGERDEKKEKTIITIPCTQPWHTSDECKIRFRFVGATVPIPISKNYGEYCIFRMDRINNDRRKITNSHVVCITSI